jgi:tRNA nucleotidyltransferase/poly(A) polymerase
LRFQTLIADMPNFDFKDKRLFIRLFGGNVYAVGGYVRDLIRKRPSPEVDILVARHAVEAVVRKLESRGRVDLVGRSFGVIKFTTGGKTYDVALPRIDTPRPAAERGHKDFEIATDPNLPIETDLSRRDFRCNSMALRLADGCLIDPFGGASDARSGRLRLTNPGAFPDDPLRVLRAARFASVLGFRIDPEIYDLSRDIDLSGLSIERVNEEFFRVLLDSRRPSRGLEELFRLGGIEKLFPELYTLSLTIQDAVFHPETDADGHHTVWGHTLLTVDQAQSLVRTSEWPDGKRLSLLLAALYHDAGKASTTRREFRRGRMTVTSRGHDRVSERIARKVLARHRIVSWGGWDIEKTVPRLIGAHHRASEIWANRDDVTRKAFNRLAADVGGDFDLPIILDAADRAGRQNKLVRSLDREARWLFRKFREFRIDSETIRPLIMGRDLIGLGVAPGPEMGRILKKLHMLQLDGVFETKDAGMEAARRLLEGKKA